MVKLELELIKDNNSPKKKWTAITSSANGDKLAAIVVGGNIWTSSNSGATWTEDTSVNAKKNWVSITSSTDGTKLAAVVFGGGKIWTSSDSGATWTEDTSVGATKDWGAITSWNNGNNLAATETTTNYGGNIWTSNDSGATWTEDTSIGATKNWNGITSSADGTKLAAVVFGGNIWTFNDEGKKWTKDSSVGMKKNWSCITSWNNGKNLVASDDDGNIYRSIDNGNNWIQTDFIGWASVKRRLEEEAGIVPNVVMGITSSKQGKLALCVQNGNIWTSNDKGNTWNEHVFGFGYQDWSDITFSSDGTKLAAVVFGGKIHTFNVIDSTKSAPTSVPTISQNSTELEKRIKVLEDYIKTSTRIENLLSVSGFSNKLENAKIKNLTANVNTMIQELDKKDK